MWNVLILVVFPLDDNDAYGGASMTIRAHFNMLLSNTLQPDATDQEVSTASRKIAGQSIDDLNVAERDAIKARYLQISVRVWKSYAM